MISLNFRRKIVSWKNVNVVVVKKNFHLHLGYDIC